MCRRHVEGRRGDGGGPCRRGRRRSLEPVRDREESRPLVVVRPDRVRGDGGFRRRRSGSWRACGIGRCHCRVEDDRGCQDGACRLTRAPPDGAVLGSESRPLPPQPIHHCRHRPSVFSRQRSELFCTVDLRIRECIQQPAHPPADLPMIDELLPWSSWRPPQIDLATRCFTGNIDLPGRGASGAWPTGHRRRRRRVHPRCAAGPTDRIAMSSGWDTRPAHSGVERFPQCRHEPLPFPGPSRPPPSRWVVPPLLTTKPGLPGDVHPTRRTPLRPDQRWGAGSLTSPGISAAHDLPCRSPSTRDAAGRRACPRLSADDRRRARRSRLPRTCRAGAMDNPEVRPAQQTHPAGAPVGPEPATS